MVRRRLAYGKEFVEWAGEGRVLAPARPRPRLEPLDGLDDFLRGARSVVAVVSDITRYTAAETILPRIPGRFRVLFANGLHRAHTPRERRAILGGRYPADDHDAFDRAENVRLGESPRGVPIAVNCRLAAADRIVLTGAIGFHYLAGYSGGWKNILPGCAAEETILGLHRLTLDARAGPGSLANPFRREIDRAARLLPTPAFVVNTVLDGAHRVVGRFCGDPWEAHARGCAWVARRFGVRVPRPADLVVASAGGHPRDINLIQAHKAIDHAARALRPGGTMIVAAECADGLGFPGFERWFEFLTPVKLFRALRRDFHTYGRTAWALWSKAEKYRIILVSRLAPDLVRAMRMTPARDLEEARSIAGPARSTILLPEAVGTLPL